jgi:hypothetical protein
MMLLGLLYFLLSQWIWVLAGTCMVVFMVSPWFFLQIVMSPFLWALNWLYLRVGSVVLDILEICWFSALLCVELKFLHWLFFKYHLGHLHRIKQHRRGEIDEVEVLCDACGKQPWMSERVHVPFKCEGKRHVFCTVCTERMMCPEWHKPEEKRFAKCQQCQAELQEGFDLH